MTKLTIAAAQRPADGEQVVGDDYVVVRGEEHVTIVALADGLGHGTRAREASRAFCVYVEAHCREPLSTLLAGVDRQLVRTRGVVAVVLRIDERKQLLQYSGVGNIELLAVTKEPIRPIPVPGILGYRQKRMRVFEYPLHDGDLITLISDGVSRHFELSGYIDLEPAQMARVILADHVIPHDDASCVVIRFGPGR